VKVTSPLHHELVAATGATPKAWILMTHGIFGSGANWRSIARKLVDRMPSWGAVLVDLRGHGRSPAGEPPHTVEACAADLRALDERLWIEGQPVRVALGHSFGGKVVLALRRMTAHRGTVRSVDLLQTWVLDATPAPRLDGFADPAATAPRVLELLEGLPPRFDRRDDFVAAVTSAGQPAPLARWLAMNLDATPDGGVALRLDLPMIRQVLLDYYLLDLWPAVEDPLMPGDLHVVVAGRSDSVPHADRERLLVHQQKTGLTYLHLVPEAGHWLHIDAPDAVVELLAGALPSF
jgi:pimeloyl-ACP methyl ester carboxylesterase